MFPRLLLQRFKHIFLRHNIGCTSQEHDKQPEAINLVELAQQIAQFERMVMKFQKKTTVSSLKMKHLTTVNGKNWSPKKCQTPSPFAFSLAQHMSYIVFPESGNLYNCLFQPSKKNTSILLLGGGSARILLKPLRNMKFRLNSSWAMKKTLVV